MAVPFSLAAILIFVGLWAPFYAGRDSASGVPLSRAHAPSARQIAAYGVGKDARVLAEITPINRRLTGGAVFYTARFAFQPYIILARCQGQWLQIQESVGYRRWLRLQVQSTARSAKCGTRQKTGLTRARPGSTVTIDVIDAQAQPNWGVLVLRDDDGA